MDDHILFAKSPIVAEAWRTGSASRCPSCFQTVKVYPRRITKTMIQNLAQIASAPEGIRSIHLKASHGGDHAKLRYWDLIEIVEGEFAHTYWKITPRGKLWLFGSIQIPEIAYVYNGTVQCFSEKMVFISDRVQKKFDLQELMERWDLMFDPGLH
jgi:hypothetical protein|tara:strand:- start:1151 stop:1615 length:465 start_codon:yes stop_codon:yes gene_type:complete